MVKLGLSKIGPFFVIDVARRGVVEMGGRSIKG